MPGRANIQRRNIGTEKLRRATLQGAMTRNGEIALLAVAPAGPPIFNLAGRAERATLTLPHDRRVLVAPAVDIVEALIGLRLAPADWLDLLSGCVAGAAGETGTRVNGATIITLGGSAGRVRVEQAGATWQIIAGERPDLLVEYPQFLGRWPSAAKLTSHPGAAIHVVLNMTIGQIFVNTPLQARLFAPVVAADYRPMTLDELRASGPLGAGGSATQTAGR